MTVVLIRRWPCEERCMKTPYEDEGSGKGNASISQGTQNIANKPPETRSRREKFRGSMALPNLDFGLLASRTVRQ